MSASGLPNLFGRALTSVHCVGVAGMGLGPLAIYLRKRGFTVSGEDESLVPAMESQLSRAGIVLTPGGSVPAGVELVVVSSAIKDSHPTYRDAVTKGLILKRRGEVLAEAVADRRLICVCGSHGKTTTTAMAITALRNAGISAGFVSGGLFGDDSLTPADTGETDWVVAEIDESDGTIGKFSPEVTVLVNLDWDHPDHYRTRQDLEATFLGLLNRTRKQILFSAECSWSRSVTSRVTGAAKVHSFGLGGDYLLDHITPAEKGMVLSLGGAFGAIDTTVRALGDFNAKNAVAALATVALLGGLVGTETLASFPGVRRRQGYLSVPSGYTVIEDYAHHPAEIAALLSSLKRRLTPSQRLLVVFQPHRYSRTRQFLADFAVSLSVAHRLYLLDVYSAGEEVIDGGTTGDLYAEVRRATPGVPTAYCGSHASSLLLTLTRDIRSGDTVVFVGAGDIDQRARDWILSLESKGADAGRWDSFAAACMSRVSADTRIRREETLAERSTLRVGGAARVLAEPASQQDLSALLKVAGERSVPVHLLGRGSNLVIPDVGVEGLVIALTHAVWQGFEILPNGSIRVGAGLRLKNLCGLAAKAGLTGFEFLEGIPGNVGGALRMNAGAMGGWMFDVVEEVRMMSRSGTAVTKIRSEMKVDYRHCEELIDAIALGAVLRPASKSESAAIAGQIDAYREKRQKSQPREPSAGCIFKNPPDNAAGRLIDQSGLKGLRVGGAGVSSVHANFIVNLGSATSADVVELVRRVRARVKAAQGIQLEPEVILYGREWKDVL